MNIENHLKMYCAIIVLLQIKQAASTGSYKQRTVINEPICLGTYEIPKSYLLSNIGLYYDENEFHTPEKLVINCVWYKRFRESTF